MGHWRESGAEAYNEIDGSRKRAGWRDIRTNYGLSPTLTVDSDVCICNASEWANPTLFDSVDNSVRVIDSPMLIQPHSFVGSTFLCYYLLNNPCLPSDRGI